MEIDCHASYPLNSENASPPGTFTVYLSCAEMARPPRTATHTAIPIVNMLLRFIAAPPVDRPHDRRGHESRRLDDGISRYLRMGLAVAVRPASRPRSDRRVRLREAARHVVAGTVRAAMLSRFQPFIDTI